MKNIENLFRKNNLLFKKINKGKITIYEFENEVLLCIIQSQCNTFKIDFSDFKYLDDKLLPYSFLMINKKTDKMYYLKISEPNNFIRNDFEATKKNELYFGKQILNNEIKNGTDLIKNIEGMGEM